MHSRHRSGTTSTRAIVFDADGAPVANAPEETRQTFPRPGWVEHDPDSLWCSAVSNARDALRRSALRAGGLGRVANQRKTVLIWERTTGQPIGSAIVWQGGRTACAESERL
jgi:glycerol kinase